jgi:hypothetical protein
MSDNANLLDVFKNLKARRLLFWIMVISAAPDYCHGMTYAHQAFDGDVETIASMPSWVTSSRVEVPEDVVFLSGAALASAHLVLSHEGVPHALLRERLALRAAETCMVFSGRPERVGELRDEVHLLRPGDQPGPAGDIYLQWRRAVVRPVSIKTLRHALPTVAPEQLAGFLDVGRGGPVAQASAALVAVLADCPRDETTALIVADAALARALGWDHVVPLLAVGLTFREMRMRGDDLRLACQRAVVASVGEAIRMASDLAQRTARLRAVAPKLRAKGAGAAVELFLTRDAVAPTALSDGAGMSDRAARRLCDRLVALGVVRELTGRAAFRLYGV